MSISYLITCHNEGQQLRDLLSTLEKYINSEDEVVILDDYSTDQVTIDVLNEFKDKPKFKLFQHKLNNNYGEHKNVGNSYCTKEWVIQLDSDELPSDVLMLNIEDILSANSDVELFYVPRRNNFIGVTNDDIRKYGWTVSKEGYLAYPDYQSRIYKNLPHIKWKKKLHETIDGAKLHAFLPHEDSDLYIYHEKTIEKQRLSNETYNKNFTEKENRGIE
jgi:glycosyltransferase involved in cell wall biosynthesis